MSGGGSLSMKRLEQFQPARLAVWIAPIALMVVLGARAGAQMPGCEGLEARGCLDRAMDAMGGREKLVAIKTEQLDVIGHTELMEQSYRQAPFITSYAREGGTVDLAGGGVEN